VLGSLSRGQLFDIMAQLKLMAMQNQGQLRELLLGHPQLSKALLQAQVLLGGRQGHAQRCLCVGLVAGAWQLMRCTREPGGQPCPLPPAACSGSPGTLL
jgi:hypothetical protein